MHTMLQEGAVQWRGVTELNWGAYFYRGCLVEGQPITWGRISKIGLHRGEGALPHALPTMGTMPTLCIICIDNVTFLLLNLLPDDWSMKLWVASKFHFLGRYFLPLLYMYYLCLYIHMTWVYNFQKFKSTIVLLLKLFSAIFCQICIFSPNDSPSKAMKNVFYFI